MYIHWSEVLLILLSITAGIQLIYFAFFYARLAFYKKPKRDSSRQHALSVVICARDEAQNLADHLPLILQQQYPSTFEVVSVDDNSFDDSKYVLEQLSKIFKNLRVVSLKQEARLIQGKKVPLSMGIKEAKYELLLLTDADCRPASPNWILHMQDAFLKEGVEIVLGYGAYEKQKGTLNKLIRFETFFTALQYLSFALAGKPYMGVGRNLAYKREEFFNVRGFMDHMKIRSGDDDLFINQAATQANCTTCFSADAFTYSKPKTTVASWFTQKRRHVATANYYKAFDQIQLSVFYALQLSFILLAIVLLAFQFQWIAVLSLIGFRYVFAWISLGFSAGKLKEKDVMYWFPVLELLLIVVQLNLFVSTLFSKPVHWK